MEIVKIHYIPAKPVKKYSEIKKIVEEMIPFVDNGIKIGAYNEAYAVAHPQVSTEPLAFFVVNSKHVGEDKDWEANAIINPEILEAPVNVFFEENGKKEEKRNIRTYKEGCFSFPFRKEKNVNRYFRIRVRYRIRGKNGKLKKIDKWIEGLPAHIFQHEFQHCCGKNIHFEKEK